MKLIFAIDPGPESSAYVKYWPGDVKPIGDRGWVDNESLISVIVTIERNLDGADIIGAPVGVIESIQGYHRNIGSEIIATIEAIGVFRHVWEEYWGASMHRLGRPKVAAHLTNSAHGTKANVRAALYEKFGPSRKLAVGSKKKPGPLHGMTVHELDALAVAVTWHEQNQGALRQAIATGRDPDRKPGYHRSPMAAS